jgi:hypothetical protein
VTEVEFLPQQPVGGATQRPQLNRAATNSCEPIEKMKHTRNFSLQDIGFYHETGYDAVAATTKAIASVLERLPQRNRWCVEFGAWDGLVGSTSRDLILNHGYSAMLIEGSPVRYADLKKNYAGNDKVLTANRFVGFSPEDGLDTILTGTPVPHDFDFLTVDIDGNDFHVWNAIVKYKPTVVMIEFNPTIPPEVHFVQPANPSVNQGCSLAALVDLSKRKGYELIAVLGVNAFFVRQEIFPAYEITDNRIESLWTKRDCVTYFFSGYDGQIFLDGCRKLPWANNIPIRPNKLQVLPTWLRNYPFTRTNRIFYTCLTDPCEVIKKIIRKLRK